MNKIGACKISYVSWVNMRVLIIEDNRRLSESLKEMLVSESYSVDLAFDGQEGEKMAKQGSYDLILLDIMLPIKDGISVCRDLRDLDVLVPIIILTAKGETDDRVLGLDSGADDYLIKPFAIDELLARMRALLRRPQSRVAEKISFLDLEIESSSHQVLKKGKEIKLTLKEYSVLEYFMRNQGKVITRDDILQHCWDFAHDSFSNIVDVYIKRLREKLKDKNEQYIKTVRGVGYKMEE